MFEAPALWPQPPSPAANKLVIETASKGGRRYHPPAYTVILVTPNRASVIEPKDRFEIGACTPTSHPRNSKNLTGRATNRNLKYCFSESHFLGICYRAFYYRAIHIGLYSDFGALV